MNRIIVVGLALAVSGVLVFQQRTLHELQEKIALQAQELEAVRQSIPVSAVTSVVTRVDPPEAAPEVPLPERSRPTPSSADFQDVRAMADLVRRSSGAKLFALTQQFQTNPEAGVESLRALIAEKDRQEEQGARAILEGSLGLLRAKGVSDEIAKRELRRYYETGSSFLQALAAGEMAKRGDESLLRDFLPEVAATKLRSADLLVRLAGVEEIAHTQSSLAVPYLATMARDEETRVRTRVAVGLALINDESAIRLLSQLQEDESPAIRDAATRSIEQIGLPR